MSIGGIYKIINKQNNNFYIGSSSDIKQRWRWHKYALRGNRHSNTYLQNAWNKYGEENFEFEVLMLCHELLLLRREQWFLDNWKPEYNVNPIASKPPSQKGKKHSKEAKEKLSKAHKGKILSKKHKNNISSSLKDLYKTQKHHMVGKRHSEKTKNKIGLSGEENSYSKLTKEKVLLIRELYSSGNYTQEELSKRFNVCRGHIGTIVRKEVWKHV